MLGGSTIGRYCDLEFWGELFKTKKEIYNGKAQQLIENTCKRGVTGYIIVYGTRVLYD